MVEISRRVLLTTSVTALAVGLLLRRWFTRQTQDSSSLPTAAPEAQTAAKIKSVVHYETLAGALRLDNPQLGVLLRYLTEKSPFMQHQRDMDASGCLRRVINIAFSTGNADIKISCYKILSNISTNPDMLEMFIKPVIPLLYEDLSSEDDYILPHTLALLVNITSHQTIIISEYNLRAVPIILSRFTLQINHQQEIVLSTLKILINMSLADTTFDTSLVYMSLIHLLHDYRNTDVLLRVLTLLRNILNSKTLKHDSNFDEEIMRGVALILSGGQDPDCADIANQIYRAMSERYAL